MRPTAGAAIPRRLRTAPLLGAMLGVAAYSILRDSQVQVPGPARWLVYVAAGAVLGQQVTREPLTALRSAAVPILVVVVLFVVGLKSMGGRG